MAEVRSTVGVLEPDPGISRVLVGLLRQVMPHVRVILIDPKGSPDDTADCTLIVAGPGASATVSCTRVDRQAPGAGDVPIIKVLASANVTDMSDWVAAGAVGFLLQTVRRAEFRTAIETVLAGGGYVSLPLLAGLFAGERDKSRDLSLLMLTPREQEILCYIALNMSNKDIARRLALSVRTVETHRLHIRRKTGAGSRIALVQLAEKFGLLGHYPTRDETGLYPGASRALHEDE
ncbi:MAG TPA: response regulator transcription factor [Rhabdaerophilum sp.]|nr:response regulator transcription factor [Rhabdaerophilum sp.]